MKRDQSLIFTTVPEEDPEHHSPVNIETAFVGTRSKARPKFLNLRSKTTDETSYSKMEDGTPFCGATSVCSTPLTDIKKVVHQGAMSICSKEEVECKKHAEEIEDSFKTESVNSILSAAAHTSLHSIDCTEKLLKATPYVNVGASLDDKKKFSSTFELREKLICLAKRITMKYYSKEPTNLNKALIADSPDLSPKRTSRTITDPTFPVFRSDGKVISKSFYEAYIETHLSLVNSEINRSKDLLSENTDDWKSIEDFDTCFRDVAKNPTEIEMQPLKKQPGNSGAKPRKSLALPLKSLTSDPSDSAGTPPFRKERYSGGVQLTPLMSKLSMLAMEERSSGFCSRDTTPSEYRDMIYTPSQPSFPFLKKGSAAEAEKLAEEQGELRKCILFVCGQQDMVVNVLLEDSAEAASDVINTMVCA